MSEVSVSERERARIEENRRIAAAQLCRGWLVLCAVCGLSQTDAAWGVRKLLDLSYPEWQQSQTKETTTDA